jgi:hypothetical protein
MAPKRPSSVAALQRAAAAPSVRSDDTIGRQEDIGSLVPERRPRPEKPVRFTLDLERPYHQFLKEFATQAEVGASKVMRALLDELRDDPELAARVRNRVWEAK